MRKAPAALLALALLALAPAAPGQGTFIFGNRPSAIGGTGAPVGFLGDQRPGSPFSGPTASVTGSAFLAQPIVNGVPIEPIVPFGTGGAAGFIVSQIVALPDHPPGTTVQVQMAAWVAALGPTYASVLAMGIGYTGISNWVNVTLSHPIDPNQAAMTGLQGFNIYTIPESTRPALAAAGLVVWLACAGRRRAS